MAQNSMKLIADQLKGEIFHVLVVDDDELNQMIINELLRHWDVIPVFAVSAEEAIQIVENEPEKYDMVLMDLYLPRMTGLEATSQLRTKFALKVPIIALTADSMRNTKVNIINAGMNDILIKPLKPDVFHETIGHYIQLRLDEKKTNLDKQHTSQGKSLKETMVDIGKNDVEFQQEMDTLFIETLEEFVIAYSQGMQQVVLDQVRFAIHKIKFAVKMYDIQELYNEAEKGRQLLVNQTYTPALAKQSIEKIAKLCNTQIKSIKQRLGRT